MKRSLYRWVAAVSLAAALPSMAQQACQARCALRRAAVVESRAHHHGLGVPKSPLPGVLTDRKLGIELAQRLGVPPENIVELSEQQVTRDGLSRRSPT